MDETEISHEGEAGNVDGQQSLEMLREIPIPDVNINTTVVDDTDNKNKLLRQEVEKLKAELKMLKYKQENEPLFNIDDHRTSDEDISFYTGFANYDTMLLCYNILLSKATLVMETTPGLSLIWQTMNDQVGGANFHHGRNTLWFSCALGYLPRI